MIFSILAEDIEVGMRLVTTSRVKQIEKDHTGAIIKIRLVPDEVPATTTLYVEPGVTFEASTQAICIGKGA